MAEYIGKNVAIARITALEVTEPRATMADVKRVLVDMPAADVAPVRHGRWEWLGANELVRGCMCGTCSVCKVRSKYITNTALCPNCGARMDGGDKHETD